MSILLPSEQPPSGSEPGPFQEQAADTPPHRGKQNAIPWMGGATLILVGLILLAGELTGHRLQNWWAFFILIPAFGFFASAWGLYQREQHLTSVVRGPLFAGILLTCVALVFLLQLDLSRYWPIFIILGGVAALASALNQEKDKS
jgi:hypothetical protein